MSKGVQQSSVLFHAFRDILSEFATLCMTLKHIFPAQKSARKCLATIFRGIINSNYANLSFRCEGMMTVKTQMKSSGPQKLLVIIKICTLQNIALPYVFVCVYIKQRSGCSSINSSRGETPVFELSLHHSRSVNPNMKSAKS